MLYIQRYWFFISWLILTPSLLFLSLSLSLSLSRVRSSVLLCVSTSFILFYDSQQIIYLASKAGWTLPEDQIEVDEDTKQRLRQRIVQGGRSVDTSSLFFWSHLCNFITWINTFASVHNYNLQELQQHSCIYHPLEWYLWITVASYIDTIHCNDIHGMQCRHVVSCIHCNYIHWLQSYDHITMDSL